MKREWKYLYRAVDAAGRTIDFYFSATRGVPAAKAFFRKAVQPTEIRIDHSGRPRTVTSGCSTHANEWGFAPIRIEGSLLAVLKQHSGTGSPENSTATQSHAPLPPLSSRSACCSRP